MKYKVGDKVRIKSLDWYNKHTNDYGHVVCGNLCFNSCNKHWCGKIVTIETVHRDCYLVKENDTYWNEIMIEGLVEDGTKPKYEDEVNGEYYSTPKYLVRPSGYQFVDENNNVINARKIVLEKKKKEYPKTYEECCYVLGFENTELVFEDDYRDINPPKEQWKRLGLMNQLNKLLICRDAYWKIAGEEMGLGKPWEPQEGVIYCYMPNAPHYIRSIFPFPTEEMRDAFKENFDPDIEICKELL